MPHADAPESIICVPRGAVFEALAGRRGLVPLPWPELEALCAAAATQPRCDDLERSWGRLFPSWVQLATYAVVGLAPGPGEPGGGPWPDRCWAYRRRGGGEARLEGGLSLGVGGHVRAGDGTGPRAEDAPAPAGRAIRGALARELAEETALRPHGPPAYLGVLFRDDRPVEAAHLGVAFAVRVADSGDVAARPSAGLEEAGWFGSATLLLTRPHFEPWSVDLIEHFAAGPRRVAAGA